MANFKCGFTYRLFQRSRFILAPLRRLLTGYAVRFNRIQAVRTSQCRSWTEVRVILSGEVLRLVLSNAALLDDPELSPDFALLESRNEGTTEGDKIIVSGA